jgi:hypothetical protein
MTELEDNDGELATTAGSRIDRVKKRHQAGRKPLFLPIPEWDGDVWVRYGKVGAKVLTAAVGGRRKRPVVANSEMLVAACQEIYVIDDETGKRVPIAEAGQQPVRFDGRLAELFELKGDTPVKIVMGMYRDDVAIGRHAQRVINWQNGEDLDETDPEELDELLGEADAEI